MYGRERTKPDYIIKGDSFIQLSDGNILSYYFRGKNGIHIYDQENFQQILEININEIILKHLNEKDKDKDYNFGYDRDEIVCSIVELEKGLILTSYKKYLIEIQLKEKSFESNIVYETMNKILNMNKLSDGKVIIIIDAAIKILNKENGKYIEKDEVLIDENWKLTPISQSHRFYGKFHQYYSSQELPNNKLLLNCFATELSYHGGCGTHPPEEFTRSKIIFIDLNNLKEISITKEFQIAVICLILKESIVIQSYKEVYIYDIQNFQMINKMKFEKGLGVFYKYDHNHIISMPYYEKENNLILYKYEKNQLIKEKEFKNDIKFNEVIGWNGYSINEYKDKNLLVLKDKRIIIVCHKEMSVIKNPF